MLKMRLKWRSVATTVACLAVSGMIFSGCKKETPHIAAGLIGKWETQKYIQTSNTYK